METDSYLLKGTRGAMEKTFGSTAHGSVIAVNRTKANNMLRGEELQKSMKNRGIVVKTASADILQSIATFKPIDNIKG